MSIADNNRSASNRTSAVPMGATLRIEDTKSIQEHRPGTRAFLSVIRSRADIGVHVFIDGPTTFGCVYF